MMSSSILQFMILYLISYTNKTATHYNMILKFQTGLHYKLEMRQIMLWTNQLQYLIKDIFTFFHNSTDS